MPGVWESTDRNKETKINTNTNRKMSNLRTISIQTPAFLYNFMYMQAWNAPKVDSTSDT